MKLAFGLHTANEMKLKYSLVQDETGTSRVILYVGYMYCMDLRIERAGPPPEPPAFTVDRPLKPGVSGL